MKMYLMSVSAAALLTAASAGVALAQTEEAAPQPTADGAAQAQQCRDDLQALGQRMQEEGYWLSGWRGGLGAGAAAPAGGATPADVPPAVDAPPAGGGTAATTPPPVDGTAAGAGQEAGMPSQAPVSPWGDTGWQTRPSEEIGTLYRAAGILAQRGDQQGCQTVLNATQTIYQEYVGRLQELGVNPDEVTGWRQEQIVNARPINEVTSSVQADNLVGTDVRNAQDENLGQVDDIVLDPQTGQIRYVVVATGGFLGLGTRDVVVPWNQLRATPGLETILLPVSQDAMEQAPEFRGQGEGAQELDQYWSQALGEQAVPQQGQQQ
ncbi:PRC-barrel domain-containing protein [Geminicoccus harenae]|uniref:PRC-barrel domain-containing protein n=2 Tax=Geminicoccus harenae TaxID=2498453 RepID=UPI001C98C4B8|nr:PRC-barrel domain-containing protein [Geminicoccus harenae]